VERRGVFVMGDLLFWLGQLAQARVHLEQGIALCDPARDRFEASRFALSDNGMNCHAFLARALWHLGFPDQALAHNDQATTLAEDAALPASTGMALSWAAALRQLRGEVNNCRMLADACLAFTTEHALLPFAAHAMILQGCAGQTGPGRRGGRPAARGHCSVPRDRWRDRAAALARAVGASLLQ